MFYLNNKQHKKYEIEIKNKIILHLHQFLMKKILETKYPKYGKRNIKNLREGLKKREIDCLHWDYYSEKSEFEATCIYKLFLDEFNINSNNVNHLQKCQISYHLIYKHRKFSCADAVETWNNELFFSIFC